MRRGEAIAAGIGVVGMLAWLALALFSMRVMPSYFAAWLFWMAVPLGALPLVMAMEAMGVVSGRFLAVLRSLLPLLPVGALLAIPFLLGTGVLFHRADQARALPAGWMAPGWFVGRTILILVVLSALALLFSGAPRRRPRRGLAIFGLMLHVCLLSVAAVDWVLALQPGIASSEMGLLLIASQLGVAGCLAGFIVAVGSRENTGQPALGPLLASLLGVWAFLHFVQYLVVWSANLPDEIVWYQARTPGLGGFTLWFAAAAVTLGLALLPTQLAHIPAVLASLAAMLLLMHMLETFWLITPAFRGHFTIDLADVFALFGLGGLAAAGLMRLLGPSMRVSHATA